MVDSSRVLVKSSVNLMAKISLPKSFKPVIGDPHRLSQCLNNFLSNAAKFTAQGEINLMCSLVETKRGENGIEYVKIRFEITDTGIGMSAETLKKLFQPFVQVLFFIPSSPTLTTFCASHRLPNSYIERRRTRRQRGGLEALALAFPLRSSSLTTWEVRSKLQVRLVWAQPFLGKFLFHLALIDEP